MNKKINFLAILFLATVFSANATVWTVSNNPNSPGQYTDIQSAVDAASAGDTIYVSGSETNYGNFTIDNKELHIIGAGYKPNNLTGYATHFYSVYFKTSGNIFSSSGTTITGCYIDSRIDISGTSDQTIENITISRCFFGSYLIVNSYSTNILIYNNIIGWFQSANQNVGNLEIYNNIIIGYQVIQHQTNVITKNNLFIKSSGSIEPNGVNTIFENNIFYGYSPYQSSFSNCTFNNNISYNTVDDNFNTSGSNSGSGNIVGQDPQFKVDNNFTFDYEDDYNLEPTSPGKAAGTDGADIGLYGGTYPWPEGGISESGFMYSQESTIPQVYEMTIQNASIGLNGTINVQVKAHKQD